MTPKISIETLVLPPSHWEAIVTLLIRWLQSCIRTTDFIHRIEVIEWDTKSQAFFLISFEIVTLTDSNIWNSLAFLKMKERIKRNNYTCLKFLIKCPYIHNSNVLLTIQHKKKRNVVQLSGPFCWRLFLVKVWHWSRKSHKSGKVSFTCLTIYLQWLGLKI